MSAAKVLICGHPESNIDKLETDTDGCVLTEMRTEKC